MKMPVATNKDYPKGTKKLRFILAERVKALISELIVLEDRIRYQDPKSPEACEIWYEHAVTGMQSDLAILLYDIKTWHTKAYEEMQERKKQNATTESSNAKNTEITE